MVVVARARAREACAAPQNEDSSVWWLTVAEALAGM
jgi:hypothetical protein